MRGFPIAITNALSSDVMWIRALIKFTVGSTAYRWTDASNDIYFDGNWWYSKEIRYGSIEQAINGGISNIEMKITNVDNALSNLALGSRDIRGCPFIIYKVPLNINLHPIGVTIEADLVSNDCVVLDGLVDSAKFDRQDATLMVVDDMINSYIVTPRRTFYPHCRWVFGNANTCGYTLGTIPAVLSPIDGDTYACILAHTAANGNKPGSVGGEPYWLRYGTGGVTWVSGTAYRATLCDHTKPRCILNGRQDYFGGWEYIFELIEDNVYWGQRTKTWGAS